MLQPTTWERDTFHLLAKQCTAIRRDVPLPPSTDLFPRFIVFEEIYASPQEARARVGALHSKRPPDLEGEAEKIFPLRDGFARGRRVFIVTTDALAFQETGKQLTAALQAWLAGQSMGAAGAAPCPVSP